MQTCDKMCRIILLMGYGLTRTGVLQVAVRKMISDQLALPMPD